MNRENLVAFICSILLLLEPSWSFPFGAPETACSIQMPQHNADALPGEAPYDITFGNRGNILTVTITADETSHFPAWKGLLVTVRDLRGQPAGPIIDIDESDYQPLCDNGVTHLSDNNKSFSQFRWEIPEIENIDIQFTFVQHRNTFWVFRRSYVILRQQVPSSEQPRIRDVIDEANDGRRAGPADLTTTGPTRVAPPDFGDDASRSRVVESISVVAPADLGDDASRSTVFESISVVAPADLGDDASRSRFLESISIVAPADLGDDGQRSALDGPVTTAVGVGRSTRRIAPADIGEGRSSGRRRL